MSTGTVSTRVPEGRPIVRRFVVKRLPLSVYRPWPWIVRDREHPERLGSAPTHAEAIAMIARRLEYEANR